LGGGVISGGEGSCVDKKGTKPTNNDTTIWEASSGLCPVRGLRVGAARGLPFLISPIFFGKGKHWPSKNLPQKKRFSIIRRLKKLSIPAHTSPLAKDWNFLESLFRGGGGLIWGRHAGRLTVWTTCKKRKLKRINPKKRNEGIKRKDYIYPEKEGILVIGGRC